MDDWPGTSHPRRREIVSSRMALKIVLEDADLLVADKPAGMLVEPLPRNESGEVTLVIHDPLSTTHYTLPTVRVTVFGALPAPAPC